MNIHSHQCGLTIISPTLIGCGYIWSHPDQEDWKLKDHYCPKCGMGPFTMKYKPDESKNSVWYKL